MGVGMHPRPCNPRAGLSYPSRGRCRAHNIFTRGASAPPGGLGGGRGSGLLSPLALGGRCCQSGHGELLPPAAPCRVAGLRGWATPLPLVPWPLTHSHVVACDTVIGTGTRHGPLSARGEGGLVSRCARGRCRLRCRLRHCTRAGKGGRLQRPREFPLVPLLPFARTGAGRGCRSGKGVTKGARLTGL